MIVSSNGGDFKPVPEGTYVAVCIRVIDLGTQLSSFQGADKLQRKVLIAWEIPDETVDIEGEQKPALIQSRYTASLSDRATLRKHLEAWRGRRFTDDELRGFDLSSVLGKPCQIQVLHTEREGNTYANVHSIMATIKGLPAPPPAHPLVHLDLDKFDRATFEGLSEKLQQQISLSPEYKRATGQMPPDDRRSGAPAADLDDEIPF